LRRSFTGASGRREITPRTSEAHPCSPMSSIARWDLPEGEAGLERTRLLVRRLPRIGRSGVSWKPSARFP
jgi:hypothetical protein